jgi:uncharacterized protein
MHAIFSSMYPRHPTNTIKALLADFPAVMLLGPRQAGKSTLAKQLVTEKILSDYVTLDDLTLLEAATHDPTGFLKQYQSRLAIDEIQRVPELLIALKRTIDNDRTPGRFLLTGSANVLAYEKITESLAGRVAVISLEGLSWREQLHKDTPATFVNDILSKKTFAELLEHWQANIHQVNNSDLARLIYYGGFPEVVKKSNQDFTQRWFASYQKTYVERDVHLLHKMIDIIPYNRLLQLIAHRTGNLFNINDIRNTLQLDQRTIKRYLGLLEMTYQVKQLLPWHANANKRLVKTPKIFSYDSGFSCFLQNLSSVDELMQVNSYGNLAETWLYAELRKLLSLQASGDIYFYRTHQQQEVDFILRLGQQCIAIELKTAHKISAKDFRGLRDWQQSQKNKSLGVIFYLGERVQAFGENLVALPMSVLA